jgi:hypothetical protein
LIQGKRIKLIHIKTLRAWMVAYAALEGNGESCDISDFGEIHGLNLSLAFLFTKFTTFVFRELVVLDPSLHNSPVLMSRQLTSSEAYYVLPPATLIITNSQKLIGHNTTK